MWDWVESNPASPLYYSWGGMVLNFNKKGEDKWSVPRDDNLRLRPTINVCFS